MKMHCAHCEVSWDGDQWDRCWVPGCNRFGEPGNYEHRSPATATFAQRHTTERLLRESA